MNTRIGEWAQQFGISIDRVSAQPGEIVLRVKDIFTTRDGSWEPSDKPGSVPAWARAQYLKPTNHPQYNDDGGADHHLFGAVMEDNGGFFRPWGDIRFYTYTDDKNHVNRRVKLNGWANIPIFGSSGIPGPWAWHPASGIKADLVKGGGLPGAIHVSWYAVWQPVKESGGIVVPPIDPPTAPELTIESLAIRVAELERRVNAMDGDGR